LEITMVKARMFRAAVAASLIASSVVGASAVTAQTTTETTEVEEDGGADTATVLGILFGIGAGVALVFLSGDEDPVSP
jgi:hypothetical protein